MIIIKSACSKCGEVLVRSYDVQLHLTPDEAAGYYEFKCPNCGTVITGEADHRFIKILLANGIKPVDDVAPGIHDGKLNNNFTWNDYLDFILELKNGAFENELTSFQKHST